MFQVHVLVGQMGQTVEKTPSARVERTHALHGRTAGLVSDQKAPRAARCSSSAVLPHAACLTGRSRVPKPALAPLLTLPSRSNATLRCSIIYVFVYLFLSLVFFCRIRFARVRHLVPVVYS